MSAARAQGWEVVGLLDDDPARVGELVLGVPILGPTSMPLGSARAVLAIGDNAARARLAGGARP